MPKQNAPVPGAFSQRENNGLERKRTHKRPNKASILGIIPKTRLDEDKSLAKIMQQYDLFDGKTYLYTVSSYEDPFAVLDEERRQRASKARLRLEMVDNCIRTEVAGPIQPLPDDREWEEIAEEWEGKRRS